MPLILGTETGSVQQRIFLPPMYAMCGLPTLFIFTFLSLPPLALANSLFATFLLFFSPFLLLLNTFHFIPTHLLSLPLLLVSGLRRSLPSSPPLLSPSVPIRRNLIGNQSFWWKNGVGLSITVPWVLPAERGVQKRLHIGTAVGKVNAADSLSLAVFPCVQDFSLTHTLTFSLFQSCCISVAACTSQPQPDTAWIPVLQSTGCVAVDIMAPVSSGTAASSPMSTSTY